MSIILKKLFEEKYFQIMTKLYFSINSFNLKYYIEETMITCIDIMSNIIITIPQYYFKELLENKEENSKQFNLLKKVI